MQKAIDIPSAPPRPCSFSHALSCSLYYLIISEGQGFPSCIIGRFQDILSATLDKISVMLQKWETSQPHTVPQICLDRQGCSCQGWGCQGRWGSNCEKSKTHDGGTVGVTASGNRGAPPGRQLGRQRLLTSPSFYWLLVKPSCERRAAGGQEMKQEVSCLWT